MRRLRRFVPRLRHRTLIGLVLFPSGALLGYVSFWVAFAIFLALPLVYGVTNARD